MAITISSSPSSFSFGNLQPNVKSVPQGFVLTAKDPMSTLRTSVQFKVEAFKSGLSQFLLEPSSGWIPSGGDVTSATSPVFTYGPGPIAGHVDLNVVCIAGLPTGLASGHLELTLLRNGNVVAGPVRVDLSVNVVQQLQAAAAALI